jgi:hypothetical protein
LFLGNAVGDDWGGGFTDIMEEDGRVVDPAGEDAKEGIVADRESATDEFRDIIV